jgi:hypothetical protein
LLYRCRCVDGICLRLEHGRLQGGFRELMGGEGTRRLLLWGRISGREVVFESGLGELAVLEERRTSWKEVKLGYSTRRNRRLIARGITGLRDICILSIRAKICFVNTGFSWNLRGYVFRIISPTNSFRRVHGWRPRSRPWFSR